MSRIRRMFAYGPHIVNPLECLVVYRISRATARKEPEPLISRKGNAQRYHPRPVLVVPYNPDARLAMIRRTVRTLWPRAKGAEREKCEALVLHVLGTALTPR